MTKKQYPNEIPFVFMGFTWVVKFLNIAGDCYGDTDSDQKEVRIYYKDRSTENVCETLIHELHHVVLFDLSDSIFHFESDRVYNKEENLVRLLSPRVFHLIRSNKKLMSFIGKELK